MPEDSPQGHVEYERRWLVVDPSITDGHYPTLITQAYLFVKDGWTFRIRRAFRLTPGMRNDEGYNTLAIKGPRVNASRIEVESETTAEKAKALFGLSTFRVFKSRYQLVDAGRIWDVDVFHLDNEGLVIAECESDSPVEDFEPPAWCGQAITDDPRYDNENLAQRPFRFWA